MIETSKGRFLVVEVKSTRDKLTYEKNKQEYKGKREDLFDEVFAKELGFKQFEELNKNFEYRIIFDAGLQAQQIKLNEEIAKFS